MEVAKDKLRFLATNSFPQIQFEHIRPAKSHVWINQVVNDFDKLLPLVDKDVKVGKGKEAIFQLFTRGVSTQRDDWVYDFSREALEKKMHFLVEVYQKSLQGAVYSGELQIKWDRELSKYRERGIEKSFEHSRIVQSMYRPFVKKWLYFDEHFNGMTYQLPSIFPAIEKQNVAIFYSDRGFRSPFSVLASNTIADLHLCASTDGFQCLPLYRYDNQGNRVDNITDWALAQFHTHYQPQNLSFRAVPGEESRSPSPSNASGIPYSEDFVRNDMTTESPITKRDIFHYVYAVLHHPAYRQKYELNLKREFPRIPFYADFWQWTAWGAQLLHLHLHYETIEPYPLTRTDVDPDSIRQPYKAKLKADKSNGIIELDTYTTLSGVPAVAWEYKLGNRSAIEWVLDRYKESKPKDPTIRAQFNSYRFRDYKEQVIALLGRVTAVSVQTMQIVAEMETGLNK